MITASCIVWVVLYSHRMAALLATNMDTRGHLYRHQKMIVLGSIGAPWKAYNNDLSRPQSESALITLAPNNPKTRGGFMRIFSNHIFLGGTTKTNPSL